MRNAKADRNQKEIVAALRQMGCTVESLHRVGKGVPDLLVGFNGRNHLVEVKVPGNRLNPTQHDWIANWRGTVLLVEDIDDARYMVKRMS